MGKGLKYSNACQESEHLICASGVPMAVRKDIFTELGGFDEDFFMYFEDIDLSWRMWLYGYKVVLSPKSVVYHYGSTTVNSICKNFAHVVSIESHYSKNVISILIKNFAIGYIDENQ